MFITILYHSILGFLGIIEVEAFPGKETRFFQIHNDLSKIIPKRIKKYLDLCPKNADLARL